MVFFDSKDYQTFLDYIYFYGNLYKVDIPAHCLMPNHFHLVVKSTYVSSNISKMMHSAMTRFCVYSNQRYQMIGRTFQGTYKHTVIDNEYAYNRLMRYLRDNPVEAGMVKEGQYYKWLRT